VAHEVSGYYQKAIRLSVRASALSRSSSSLFHPWFGPWPLD